jgi:hypothetical protein
MSVRTGRSALAAAVFMLGGWALLAPRGAKELTLPP